MSYKIESAISDFEKWENEFWGKPTDVRKALNKKAKDRRYYSAHKEECNRRSSEYNSSHQEQRRETNKRYYRKNAERESIRMKEYISNNKEKYSAHLAVQRAIRSGELVKESCCVCGSTSAEAHHEDYNKQLDVLWLCHKCHMRHHAGATI